MSETPIQPTFYPAHLHVTATTLPQLRPGDIFTFCQPGPMATALRLDEPGFPCYVRTHSENEEQNTPRKVWKLEPIVKEHLP